MRSISFIEFQGKGSWPSRGRCNLVREKKRVLIKMLLGIFFLFFYSGNKPRLLAEQKNKHQIECRELETSITVPICVMDTVPAI